MQVHFCSTHIVPWHFILQHPFLGKIKETCYISCVIELGPKVQAGAAQVPQLVLQVLCECDHFDRNTCHSLRLVTISAAWSRLWPASQAVEGQHLSQVTRVP